MAIEIEQLGTTSPAPSPRAPQAVKPAERKRAEELTVLEEERIYRRGVVTIRDLIAPASFEVHPTYLVLSGVYVRTLFVITYPRYIGLGWSASVINLNKTFDVAMHFYPVKANIILKQLQKRVGVLEAGIFAAAEKGAPRDPLAETALRDVEGLRDALTQGIEHFFQFSFYIPIYSTNEEDLDRYTS